MSDSPHEPGSFMTTQWSVVVQAGAGDAAAAEHLAILCGRYWQPLYAYVRRRVRDAAEAQDLTQEFFARLLEKNLVQWAAPDRGRFRAFLLGALKNFLANEWDRAHALKRGGGKQAVSLDFQTADSRCHIEPAHHETPERVFEREWALRLLEIVFDRLRDEFDAAKKTAQFEVLQGFVARGGDHASYPEAAARLRLSEEAVRQAVHRLRKRYRDLLREEVGRTVAEPDEVDEEIRCLFEAFGA